MIQQAFCIYSHQPKFYFRMDVEHFGSFVTDDRMKDGLGPLGIHKSFYCEKEDWLIKNCVVEIAKFWFN